MSPCVYFPVVPVTKYPKPGGLQPQKTILSQFWSWEFKLQGRVALCSLRGLQGGSCLPLPAAAPGVPQLWPHPVIPASVFTWPLLRVCVSPCVSIIRTLVTGFTAHSENPGWSHLKISNLITSVKTLLPNEVTWGFPGLGPGTYVLGGLHQPTSPPVLSLVPVMVPARRTGASAGPWGQRRAVGQGVDLTPPLTN